jgi:hypothetical protein
MSEPQKSDMHLSSGIYEVTILWIALHIEGQLTFISRLTTISPDFRSLETRLE